MFSIIIPVYNESLGLPNFLDELRNEISNISLPVEIIFIDDASIDDSSLILSKFAEHSINVVDIKLLHNQINLGYGASIKRGLKSSKFNLCAVTDSDTTYPVRELLDLMSKYEPNSNSMLVGARSGKFYQGGLVKKYLRKALRVIVEYMANRSIPDINSGIRVFDKRIILDDMHLLSDRFSFTTSLTLVFMLKGETVNYSPVTYRKRAGGSKVRLFSDSIRTLTLIIAVSFYFSPLKVLYPIILILFFASVVVLLLSILKYSNFLLLIGVFCFINLFIIIGFGLLAQLLSFGVKK